MVRGRGCENGGDSGGRLQWFLLARTTKAAAPLCFMMSSAPGFISRGGLLKKGRHSFTLSLRPADHPADALAVGFAGVGRLGGTARVRAQQRVCRQDPTRHEMGQLWQLISRGSKPPWRTHNAARSCPASMLRCSGTACSSGSCGCTPASTPARSVRWSTAQLSRPCTWTRQPWVRTSAGLEERRGDSKQQWVVQAWRHTQCTTRQHRCSSAAVFRQQRAASMPAHVGWALDASSLVGL